MTTPNIATRTLWPALLALPLLACDSSTGPVAEPLTLVQYNGSPLPFSGTRSVGFGDEGDPVHCYEVLAGELMTRAGIYSLMVTGRESQNCEFAWTDKVIHSGSEEYRIFGDSIHFSMVQGMGGRPSGRVSGDTITMFVRPVPAAAGYGERTLMFVPKGR